MSTSGFGAGVTGVCCVSREKRMCQIYDTDLPQQVTTSVLRLWGKIVLFSCYSLQFRFGKRLARAMGWDHKASGSFRTVRTFRI